MVAHSNDWATINQRSDTEIAWPMCRKCKLVGKEVGTPHTLAQTGRQGGGYATYISANW